MRKLVIAEKPSLARSIAEALPGPHNRRGDHIECGGGFVVAWVAGHILELQEPEDLDPAFEKWALEHLPIVPAQWKLKATEPKLLKSIKEQLKQATSVVHAGDPDREGQLLVDEVLEHLGYAGHVERLLVKDLSPASIRAQLAALQPNARFQSLSAAARGRQRADWLFGLNLTRCYTVLGRAGGHRGVLSVGRVQTPVLGLVVRRDLEIEAFQPKPYFTLQARMDAAGGAFRAEWVPGPGVRDHLDEEGRLLHREVADDVQRRTQGQVGQADKATRERKSESAPLPYSLAELQKDAARALGLTIAQTLEAAQSLYETHKLTSYPRSDCSFLPEAQHADAPTVLAAITSNLPAFAPHAAQVDVSLRSRAWNDAKVTAHYAIIPTTNARPGVQLSDAERGVYELVCRRYLAQFLPAYEYLQLALEVLVAGERFRATGRQPLVQGWRALQQPAAAEEGEAADDASAPLPPLQVGDAVKASEVRVEQKATQPPKRFTEATLLDAMLNVERFVEDPRVKEMFRKLKESGGDTDEKRGGIGTPATRDKFIEKLVERGFIERTGKGKAKQLISTPVGRGLIQQLPRVATTPDMTAIWEEGLRRVEGGTWPLADFMAHVEKKVRDLVQAACEQGALRVGELHPCRKADCAGVLRRIPGKKGPFWSCDKCRSTVEDDAGKPAAADGAVRPRRGGGRRRASTMGRRSSRGSAGTPGAPGSVS